MARIGIDLGRRIGTVDRRIFGNFIEHLGRCIYGGLYEEGSPLSDAAGSSLFTWIRATGRPTAKVRNGPPFGRTVYTAPSALPRASMSSPTIGTTCPSRSRSWLAP
jgi:hypothetical protein